MNDFPCTFVIGCGSIGQRHIANLLTLGVTDVLAYDVRADRRAQAEARYPITTVDSLETGWQRRPDVSLIAAPTSLHIPLALEAAKNGCNLFIEKPLGDRSDGAEQLISIVTGEGLTAMVGCNMRFHHGPATVKRLLDEGTIGQVITGLIDAGQYLPDWHPGEDYRDWYSASSALGGGVVLDAIHEIDYARWLFGEVEEVYCLGGKYSSLEIDTEDSANILMKLVTGTSVSIHLDYVQRAYWRTCKVVGEEGTIVWDMNRGDVQLFLAGDKSWRRLPQPEGYTVNQMYLDEMAHFLRCLKGEDVPSLGIHEAKRVLDIALAIKASMHSGEVVRVAA